MDDVTGVCTYPQCKCIVGTSSSQPEPRCPLGKTRSEVRAVREREKYILCPVCEGRGVTVDPSVDAHGLTRADFANDPEFERDYWSGMYDIECRGCKGRRVVTEDRIRELERHAEERELAACEDGNWKEFSGARDWRFG